MNGELGEPRTRMSRGRRYRSPTNGGRFPVNGRLGEPRMVVVLSQHSGGQERGDKEFHKTEDFTNNWGIQKT